MGEYSSQTYSSSCFISVEIKHSSEEFAQIIEDVFMDKKDKEKKNQAMSYLNKNKGMLGKASRALTGRKQALDKKIKDAGG
jgi:hypothetical protein